MLLFAAHLVGFTVLGLRRRQWYYLALMLTFGLLTASFAFKLFAPTQAWAGLAAYLWLRYLAWAAAAVSISWTAMRAMHRRGG